MSAPKNKELIFKDVVRYEDGCLYWVKPIRLGMRGGTRAGTLAPSGYWLVGYQGIQAREHRIIWMLHHGEIPAGMQVDHINRDRSDNRIENLRLVTNRANSHNKEERKLPTNVMTRRGRFRVQVRVNGPKKTVGTYDTLEEAIEARNEFHEAHGFGAPADFV